MHSRDENMNPAPVDLRFFWFRLFPTSNFRALTLRVWKREAKLFSFKSETRKTTEELFFGHASDFFGFFNKVVYSCSGYKLRVWIFFCFYLNGKQPH